MIAFSKVNEPEKTSQQDPVVVYTRRIARLESHSTPEQLYCYQ